jgi:hypothetical protein
VLPHEPVGLEREDEAQALVAPSAREERHRRARAGVGVVEVLEDEKDGPVPRDPGDDAEDRLQHPTLSRAPRHDGPGRGEEPDRVQAVAEPRHDPRDLVGARADDLGEVRVRHGRDVAGERLGERRERQRAPGRMRGAPEHDVAGVEVAEAAPGLVEQACLPDARGPGDEHGRGPRGRRGLERVGHPREIAAPADHAVAHVSGRHDRHPTTDGAPLACPAG